MPERGYALLAAIGFMLAVAACAPPQLTPTPAPPTPAAASSVAAAASPSATAVASPPQPTPAVSPVAKPAISPAGALSPSPSVSAFASPSAVAAARPASTPLPAPSPPASGLFGFGRAPTTDELARVNIDIRPDGQGLPPGGGIAGDGQPIYAAKCASCHGPNGEGTSAAPRLVDATPYHVGVNQPTIGNYWPYATTVWDYIHRAMPFNAPGSLSNDEVYALTAYLLAQNQVIGANDRMDAQSLPQVKMPNQQAFTAPDPRPDVP
jgi:S-disulfanyl-L-cysteine oxidoreductase SoxD